MMAGGLCVLFQARRAALFRDCRCIERRPICCPRYSPSMLTCSLAATASSVQLFFIMLDVVFTKIDRNHELCPVASGAFIGTPVGSLPKLLREDDAVIMLRL